MANKYASNILKLLYHGSGIPKHRIKPRISASKCLTNLLEYLLQLKTSYGKNDYISEPEYLISQVYKKHLKFKTETEFNCYARCQLQLAVHFFQLFLNHLKTSHGNLRYWTVIKYSNIIHDFMHDIRRFVEYFERKREPEYVFFEGGKNYGQTGWQIFRSAQKLFWSQQTSDDDLWFQRTSLNNSVFCLRQALEVKSKNIVGIADLYDSNGQAIRLRNDFYLKFLSSNLEIITSRYKSLASIIKIYNWTNTTIHTGVIPNIWEIQFALYYCHNFFSPDKPIKMEAWHRDSAIKIHNYDELLNRFSKEIAKETKNKMVCISLKEPEAWIKK